MRTKKIIVLITTLHLLIPFSLHSTPMTKTLSQQNVLRAGQIMTASGAIATLIFMVLQYKQQRKLAHCPAGLRECCLSVLRNYQAGTFISSILTMAGIVVWFSHALAVAAEDASNTADSQRKQTNQLKTQVNQKEKLISDLEKRLETLEQANTSKSIDTDLEIQRLQAELEVQILTSQELGAQIVTLQKQPTSKTPPPLTPVLAHGPIAQLEKNIADFRAALEKETNNPERARLEADIEQATQLIEHLKITTAEATPSVYTDAPSGQTRTPLPESLARCLGTSVTWKPASMIGVSFAKHTTHSAVPMWQPEFATPTPRK